MQKFSKALDEVRSEEVRELRKEKKEPVLSKSRWCFLKRRENLTDKQSMKLNELLKMNLKIIKAYLFKEQFTRLWSYKSPAWAGRFIDQWCKNVEEENIGPMKKVAKMIRGHRALILHYFKAKKAFNSGVVEGLNRNVNLTVRKSYGFKSLKTLEIALFHQLGKFPEREFTHKLW